MNNILIIFGKPGAGKSFVAEILEKQFDYFSFNGDDALPEDMKKALFQKDEITDDMRDRFLTNMISQITRLSQYNKKLVVHQTFLKEYMRQKVLDALPNAKFILVECEDAIREARYLKRIYFNLGIDYLRLMTGLFEAPEVTHVVIYNNKEGTHDILMQFKTLLWQKQNANG